MLFLQCLPKLKVKLRKQKGASSSAVTKQTKKATKQSRVPETPGHVLVLTEDEEGWPTEDEVAITTREVMAQKMDSMVKMLLDLSHCLKSSKTQQRDRTASPLVSLPTSRTDRRRACNQMTPIYNRDLSEAVRRRVAQRLWQLLLGKEATSDEGSTSKEGQKTNHTQTAEVRLELHGGDHGHQENNV